MPEGKFSEVDFWRVPETEVSKVNEHDDKVSLGLKPCVKKQDAVKKRGKS